MYHKQSKAVLVVLNDKGLHTRPSTELVKCASRFKATITLSYRTFSVNAKSLLGVLMLAAERGAKLTLTAEGSDAEMAVASLIQLAKNRFNIHF
jgi:phosphocarrier protein HPr